MVEEKVIRINHAVDLEYHFNRKIARFGLAMVLLVIVCFILIEMAVSHDASITAARTLGVFILISFVGAFVLPALYWRNVQFSRIEVTPNELIFATPASRISQTEYEYRIPYDRIRRIALDHRGTYKITFHRDRVNALPDPMLIGPVYSFTVPLKTIKRQENEKKLWESIEHLNVYYLKQPWSNAKLNRMKIFSSKNLEVRKLRFKEPAPIFSVNAGPGVEIDTENDFIPDDQ